MITANWTEWVESDAWRSMDIRMIPVPSRAFEDVITLAVEPDIAGRELMQMVARDPVITIRVLRLANVAAYAPARDVITIEEAVLRLGTRAVRNAVLAACFASWAQAVSTYGRRGADEVQHGIGTACLARLVAERAGSSADEAFVQGLLHDVGKLFLMRLRGEYIRLGGRAPAQAELDSVIATHHAVLGSEVLQIWGVPVSVREPVRWHHAPLCAPEQPQAAAVVYTANRLSHRYGFGCPPQPDEELLGDPVCAALEVDPRWLEEMDRQALTLLVATGNLVS